MNQPWPDPNQPQPNCGEARATIRAASEPPAAVVEASTPPPALIKELRLAEMSKVVLRTSVWSATVSNKGL